MQCFRVITKRGFTLIELLVVIAIIAILSAILFPVFARARENGRRASCASNLKQVGLALVQYTQDYDERMPFQESGGSGRYDNLADPASRSETSYFYKLYPYFKSWQLLRCPSATAVTTGSDIPNGNNNTSYMVNGVLAIKTTATGATTVSHTSRHIASIPEPAANIIVQEYLYNLNSSYLRPVYNGVSGWTVNYRYWLPSTAYSRAHFDGGNLLFADGHVKWRKLGTICTVDFGLGTPSESGKCGTSTSNATASPLY